MRSNKDLVKMEAKYFQLKEENGSTNLSTRHPFNIKEVTFILIILSIIIYFLTGVLMLAISFSITFTFLYSLVRFYNAIFYTTYTIHLETKNFKKVRNRINKVTKTTIIDSKYSPSKFKFKEFIQAGKSQFLLSYSVDRKNHDILILRSKEDKNLIREKLNI